MTRVSVISFDAVLAEVLTDAGHQAVTVDPSLLSGGVFEALRQRDGQIPEVVVVDGTVSAEPALDVARAVVEAGIGVVLVAKHESGLLLEAMRAGVREVVEPDVSEDELAAAVARVPAVHTQGVAVPSDSSSPPVQGRVIVVISAKGGVGKSTIATNLSIGLSKLAPLDVVLVDLDAQFGDVATLLDLVPEHSVLDAAESMIHSDSMLLKTFLTPHSEGVLVLAGSPSPTAADRISTEHARSLVAALKIAFGTVVIDTSAGITEQTLGALEVADEIVIVTSMDLSSLRAVAKELDLLGQLGFSTVPIQVVLNGDERKSGLLVKDVEKVIGRSIDVTLPRSDIALLAGNKGEPMILGKRKEPWVKAFGSLVTHFSAGMNLTTGEEPPPKGRRKGKK